MKLPEKPDKVKNISETAATSSSSTDKNVYHKKINEILEDFLFSQDEKEAAEAILELEAAEIRNKVVENGIMMSIEKNDAARVSMQKLFKFLSAEKILKEENFAKGFKSIVDYLPKLIVDVPLASKYVEQFKNRAMADNCISPSVASQIRLS